MKKGKIFLVFILFIVYSQSLYSQTVSEDDDYEIYSIILNRYIKKINRCSLLLIEDSTVNHNYLLPKVKIPGNSSKSYRYGCHYDSIIDTDTSWISFFTSLKNIVPIRKKIENKFNDLDRDIIIFNDSLKKTPFRKVLFDYCTKRGIDRKHCRKILKSNCYPFFIQLSNIIYSIDHKKAVVCYVGLRGYTVFFENKKGKWIFVCENSFLVSR